MENTDSKIVYQGMIGNPLVFKQKITNDESEPKTLELEFYTRLPDYTIVDKKIISATFEINETKAITYKFDPKFEGNFITNVFNEKLAYGSSVAFSVLDESKNYHRENVLIKTNPDEPGCTIMCVSPSDATIHVGDIVEWTSQVDGGITIQTGFYETGSKGTSFSSDERLVGVIPPNGKFSFLFSETGKYDYYFSDHRFLQHAGQIQVLPKLSPNELIQKILKDINRKETVAGLKSPLKQIQSGIKFHNVECKEEFKLVYKKANEMSACVSLPTAIELVVRGWGEDNRILLGCTGERISKCYPEDPQEYRKKLYEHYFGSDEDLPSFKDLNISKLHILNACNYKPTICYGEFENGTQTRISCDYPIHGCGSRNLNDYKEISIITIPFGAVIEGNQYLNPNEITVVLGKNNTVTWVNEDDTPHSFLSDKEGDDFWETGVILPGDESTIIFNHTGIFPYHGDPGPWLTGTVIVLEN